MEDDGIVVLPRGVLQIKKNNRGGIEKTTMIADSANDVVAGQTERTWKQGKERFDVTFVKVAKKDGTTTAMLSHGFQADSDDDYATLEVGGGCFGVTARCSLGGPSPDGGKPSDVYRPTVLKQKRKNGDSGRRGRGG